MPYGQPIRSLFFSFWFGTAFICLRVPLVERTLMQFHSSINSHGQFQVISHFWQRNGLICGICGTLTKIFP